MPEPDHSRRAARPAESPASEALIRDLRASLQATHAYATLLTNQLELACTSDLVNLDRVPADALVRLTVASDSFQAHADHVMAHFGISLAANARAVADVMRAHVDRRYERRTR